jgi:uncharacterized protein YndB with AHSA1/START domain
MTTLNFSVTINAPKEVVWDKLWSDAGYRQWTSAFAQGSYAESDWQQGSAIRFLTPSGEGMYGIIEKMVPYKEMTFQHRGEIKGGVEEPKDWAGARERYHLEERGGATELTVHVDSTEDFQSYFQDTFPKALQLVRQLAEGQSQPTAL